MAIQSISTLECVNEGIQNMYTVATTESWRDGVPGVPYYTSAGNYYDVQFPTTITDIGTDISIDENYYITLNTPDTTYEIQAIVNGVTPESELAHFFFVDTSNGAPVGGFATMGQSLTFTVTTGEDPITLAGLAAKGNLNKLLTSQDTPGWAYPDRLSGAKVLVKVISGYTVAA